MDIIQYNMFGVIALTCCCCIQSLHFEEGEIVKRASSLSQELGKLPRFDNDVNNDYEQSEEFITPDPPDPETTTVVTKPTNTLPTYQKFQMNEITPEQCRSLNTNNCDVLPGNCGGQKGIMASCYANASNAEIEFFFIKMAQLNASQGLKVTLEGRRDFLRRTFAPVADVLIILKIASFDRFKLSLLRNLKLPVITHISIVNSSNVEIGQDDLRFFPTLTMFVMRQSTVSKIEVGAFDSLRHLELASFGTGFELHTDQLIKQQKDYVRLLHCDCDYSWLRKFLDKHPYLLSPRKAGEIHAFGGIANKDFTRRQIYAPVDCARDDLEGTEDQIPFSVNAKC